MTDDKSRNRRRISIDEAGIEKRRSAIQALMEQPPSPAAEQAGVFADAVANGPGAGRTWDEPLPQAPAGRPRIR